MAEDSQLPWIFLSYRRANNGHMLANSIRSELEKYCGQGSVFVDADAIDPGGDWPETIRKALHRCVGTIVIIGKDWPLDKLHQSKDWVALEISSSLERNNYLLPLFVDGGDMPDRKDLPAKIASFSTRQGVSIDTRSPNIFSASLAVVGGELLRHCRSTVVLKREPQPWWGWPGIATNSWQLVSDGVFILALEKQQTVIEASIPSGFHTIAVSWSERQRILDLGVPARQGDRSFGQTKPTSMMFMPGRYVFTLNVRPPRLRDRFLRWMESYVGQDVHFYDLERYLQLVSVSSHEGAKQVSERPTARSLLSVQRRA